MFNKFIFEVSESIIIVFRYASGHSLKKNFYTLKHKYNDFLNIKNSNNTIK